MTMFYTASLHAKYMHIIEHACIISVATTCTELFAESTEARQSKQKASKLACEKEPTGTAEQRGQEVVDHAPFVDWELQNECEKNDIS